MSQVVMALFRRQIAGKSESVLGAQKAKIEHDDKEVMQNG